MKKGILFLSLFSSLLFFSCRKDQSLVDEELILEYITDNGLDTNVTDEGVYYVIDEEGSGIRPTVSDEVTVDYEGLLLNGTKFDSSYDRGFPSTFPLNAVILGWQFGIPLFKEGGSGTLIIPSRLAYGSASPGDIPANSVLLFNVELLEVE